MVKSLATGLSVVLAGCWAVAASAPEASPDRSAASQPESSAAHSASSAGWAAELMRRCQVDVKGDVGQEWRRLPEAQSSVTQHHFSAGGQSFDYTATAGTLIVRDDDDKPIASIGYVAYTRRPAHDGQSRPIMFAFNGGPGSSSLWLHMGALGPERVVVSDPEPTPNAPYRTVPNAFGVLDKSDLVMIDPVGTGLSHALCNHHDEEFWGVDPDIDSISRFIAQYVSDNDRWTSPKYLLGESYGTTRAAAIVNYLREKRSLEFNGLVLVSVATDIEAIFAELPGNDRPYAVYLPGYAAVAWYHHALPQQPPALEPFLAEVRAYAVGPYTQALIKGDALSDAERDAVAEQLHQYTGLSTEYLKYANLRVSEVMFDHELLKSERKPSAASTAVSWVRRRTSWRRRRTTIRSPPPSKRPSAPRSSTTITARSSSGRESPTTPPTSASATSGSGPTRPTRASSRSSIPTWIWPRRWFRT